MVLVAQLVEHRIVVPRVAGSCPVLHPKIKRKEPEVMADKSYKKLPASEVQGLLQMRRRGSVIKSKKGKGSYTRKRKHRTSEEVA